MMMIVFWSEGISWWLCFETKRGAGAYVNMCMPKIMKNCDVEVDDQAVAVVHLLWKGLGQEFVSQLL